jgi:outer membrane receptor protein involved in Fe transport
MSRFRRSSFIPAAALAPLAIATSAMAQTPPASSEDSTALSEVVVTGTRLTAEGFVQPTPTTMLNTEDLAKSAHPNIFNTIVELPSLQGSTGRGTFTFSTSSGLQGLSSFSMRGLGAIRTLTLLDGQRVVGANVTGVTDVSQFPQLLVKRVDVVTGGASASYGSDAIGGVVNFITDTEFEGFKTNIEYGQTTYEDDENLTVQAAWGNNFFGDRVHVQLSAEHGKEDGIPSPRFGVDNGPNGRDWFKSAQLQSRPVSQTNDGRPQLFYVENAQQFQYSKYGLITNGPLQGWAFGDNGTPYRFQYGSNGVPTGTGAVTGCITPFCVGGELDGVVSNGTTLASKLERSVGYGRIGFDINDDNQVYATFNVARVVSSNTPNPGAAKNANLTIQCANPFVPAQIQQLCTANGITSFQFGTANAIFPKDITVHPTREQERFVVGAMGDFEIAGKKWSYDAYYEHGANETDLRVRDISLTPRYNAAIDATLDAGNIVCRNVAARNAGCIPLNVIGNVAPSTGALAYVLPENGPHQFTKSTQEVVSINLSGEPFSSWAGEVAVAAGVEWREEWYDVKADPYGNGVYPDSPNTPDYPADPLMNTVSGNNWYAGNYHNGHGKYDVKEAYLEFNVPVLKSESLGDVNLNLAARATDYSTAGKVNTWKIGANWETGIDGLRFRAVASRDVRAPNLSELFAAPTVTNNAVNNNGSTVTVLQQNVGNEDLRSEVARQNTFGIVLSQPSWLPGFQASIDYYDIQLDGGISTLGAQQMVDLCNAGNQELCGAMLLNSPIPNTNFIRVQAFNLATIENKGFDLELAYRHKLEGPGSLTARLLATHTISFLTDSGVLGTIPSEAAGVNSGFTPDWKFLAVQSWDAEKFNVSLTERWFSDGVYNNEYIECQTDCPVSTAVHPTIDNNEMKGAFYLDVGGSWNFNEHSSAYFKVDNLLDQAPEPSPGTNTGQGVNPYLYDILGRMYRVGVRFSF